MIRRGKKPPERMANGLYLEWFSASNGRVVIQATKYQLHISPPSWRMTPEEDEQRARQAAVGMSGFLAQLADAVETARGQSEEGEGGAGQPEDTLVLREDEAGASLEPSPFLGDETSGAEAETSIDPELDPRTGGLWQIPGRSPRPVHPLARRCVGSAARCRERAALLGWRPAMNLDLDRFLDEFHVAAEKLMSASLPFRLSSQESETAVPPRPPANASSIEAQLNPVLEHLRAAQAAMSRLAATRFLPEEFIADGRRELIEIHLGVLSLIIAHGRPS